MKVGTKPVVLLVASGLMLFACASSKGQSGPSAPSTSAPDAALPGDAGSGAVEATDAAAPTTPAPADAGDSGPTKPFASSTAEATELINTAVDARAAQLVECVAAARARRKNPHGKIAFSLGIDQEGVLIGVKTPKGQPEDTALNDCVRTALAGSAFPRSHAGVITVSRSFQEQAR